MREDSRILARMARDILAVQGGCVGVERVFSMARDVIPYQRSRLKSSTIRSSMLVKSYENEELRREPKAILPERGVVESQYARPGPPRNQGVDHLGGSEESDPEERIWDSTVNITCMLHLTLMRRKAHKRVRRRFPVKV